jgi:hypothetical protein
MRATVRRHPPWSKIGSDAKLVAKAANVKPTAALRRCARQGKKADFVGRTLSSARHNTD